MKLWPTRHFVVKSLPPDVKHEHWRYRCNCGWQGSWREIEKHLSQRRLR